MLEKIAYKNNSKLRSLCSKPLYLPRTANERGTTACIERAFERVRPEVNAPKDRLTNSYNSTVGSEVPLVETHVQSMTWYVVQDISNCLKQPAVRDRIEGSPKGSKRHNKLELGIARNRELSGRRRIHSTSKIGKESSLISGLDDVLSGSYENTQLQALKKKAENFEQLDNLSRIMSDPKYLIGCWIKIRSNKGSLTPAFNKDTLDGINLQWFINTANSIRKGGYNFSPARRIYISKANGKMRAITIPDPKDKIVQEGMRQLLEIIYEPRFLECSHGWRSKKGCQTSINNIKMTFGSMNWFIEGDINQQFSSLDYTVLVDILRKDIKDQPFIDLIYKYLKTAYGEKRKAILPISVGVIQGGILSPLLANIYMCQFDQWVTNVLIKEFDKGIRKKANPDYTKAIRNNKIKGKIMRTTITNDENYKRLRYIRYADDFLMGVIGSREDCVTVINKVKQFLNSLKLDLSLEKTKITHATKESAKFLGYRIHITKITKQPIRKLKNNKVSRVVPRPMIDAPIQSIVQKLSQRKYAKANGNPTRNGRLIHLQLTDIVKHYKDVERGILEYYSYCSNYGRFAARVHYILKYSCALTIANKMRLKTLRGTFKKYGKNLSIKNDKNEVIQSYPTISYKKPKKRLKLEAVDTGYLIDNLVNRIGRGRGDLKASCQICGSENNIEIHHIKHLRKGKIKNDWITEVMRKMNRKQIPVCKECHINIHRGTANPKIKLGKFNS